ncbi:hypothetical protein PBY51_006042 [Eleginops maclovinus]|uniref:Uncharacterized protein n=1 Tax=Eleginops maclovinus TaxID=56733 RepID=A0AAN8AB28_ELEMC|nr:hypothetical protein PBY51_006042 [Eleginops maclovinus]
MPPVFTVIRADDVFKVARQLGDGRMLRGIPAIETFQFMKCANQAAGEGRGTEIRQEWNSQARARPPQMGED